VPYPMTAAAAIATMVETVPDVGSTLQLNGG
jgi:hypothetical protein